MEGKIVLDLKETDNADYKVVEKISVNLECTSWGADHTYFLPPKLQCDT